MKDLIVSILKDRIEGLDVENLENYLDKHPLIYNIIALTGGNLEILENALDSGMNFLSSTNNIDCRALIGGIERVKESTR